MYKRRLRFGELIKRLFFVLILGSAALLAGSKFYIEHRVTSFLDRITLNTSSVGDFRYLDVYSTFDGRIGVEGVGFYPSPDVDMIPVIVDEIVLSTPGYLYLLGIKGDGFPRSMGLALKGLRVDTGSFFNLGPGTDGASISGNPFESLACGNVDNFRAPDLANMGFQGADRVNLNLDYNMLPSGSATLSLVQNTADISSIRLLLNFNASGLHLLAVGQLPPGIVLKSGTLSITASSFSESRNRYCAQLTDLTEEQFVEANIKEALTKLGRQGLRPESELIDQYRAFMLGSGWILESKPTAPLAMPETLAMGPALLINRLNLKSKLTGQQYSPFRLSRVERVLEQAEVQSGLATPVMDPLTGVVPSADIVRKTTDPLIEVSRAEMGSFVDHYVKIKTNRQEEYIGVLLEVIGSGLRIRTRMPGGSADIEIPYARITSVTARESVYNRVLNPPEQE
jgi:hypothetical protein